MLKFFLQLFLVFTLDIFVLNIQHYFCNLRSRCAVCNILFSFFFFSHIIERISPEILSSEINTKLVKLKRFFCFLVRCRSTYSKLVQTSFKVCVRLIVLCKC